MIKKKSLCMIIAFHLLLACKSPISDDRELVPLEGFAEAPVILFMRWNCLYCVKHDLSNPIKTIDLIDRAAFNEPGRFHLVDIDSMSDGLWLCFVPGLSKEAFVFLFDPSSEEISKTIKIESLIGGLCYSNREHCFYYTAPTKDRTDWALFRLGKNGDREEIYRGIMPTNGLSCPSLSPNEEYIAFSTKTGKVDIWDLKTSKVVGEIDIHAWRWPGPVWIDNQRIFDFDRISEEVVFYNFFNGEKKTVVSPVPFTTAAAFGSDGKNNYVIFNSFNETYNDIIMCNEDLSNCTKVFHAKYGEPVREIIILPKSK